MFQTSQGQPPKGCREPCQQWDNRLTYQHRNGFSPRFSERIPPGGNKIRGHARSSGNGQVATPELPGVGHQSWGWYENLKTTPQKNFRMFICQNPSGYHIIWIWLYIRFNNFFFSSSKVFYHHFLVYQRRFLESWTGTSHPLDPIPPRSEGWGNFWCFFLAFAMITP